MQNPKKTMTNPLLLIITYTISTMRNKVKFYDVEKTSLKLMVSNFRPIQDKQCFLKFSLHDGMIQLVWIFRG